jgi:hypothetical protein
VSPRRAPEARQGAGGGGSGLSCPLRQVWWMEAPRLEGAHRPGSGKASVNRMLQAPDGATPVPPCVFWEHSFETGRSYQWRGLGKVGLWR